MTTTLSRRIRVGAAILMVLFVLPQLPVIADTVTLKNGQKLEGTITLEADDFIKLEMSRSGSIKETKIIKRSEISGITKVSPDVVAFEKLKASLPTPSLLTSSKYQELIQNGPEAWLKAYPDSILKGEVQKILEELNAEKDKVDRGSIKLGGKWITAEERQNFNALTKSNILLYTMKQKASQRNYISALRDLENIENNYIGTPAYPEAIKVALSILPTYGNQLTQTLKNVEYITNKREADIKLLPPEKQAATQAAFQKEQDRFKALAEQEKKTGIKWRSVNPRNAESITPMIETIRKELERLRAIDTEKLTEEAKVLVEVDQLINQNKLKEAQELLVEAGGKVSSGKRKSSSRTRKSGGANYSSALSNKITAKIKAQEEAAKNATLAAKAKELAANIIQKGDADKKETEGKGEEAKPEEEPKVSALEAARAARQQAADSKKKESESKTASKTDSKKKSSQSKPKPKPKKSPPPAASSGGGINFQVILIGFAAVMGIVIVVMKKMGIGGGSGGE